MKHFKAVIFDMDGVLVDTESYYLNRRNEFFESHHISIEHMKNRDFIGGNLKDLWPMILGDNYTESKAKELGKAYRAYKDSIPLPYADLLFSDVKGTLDYLKKENYRIALASSSSMDDINTCIDTHHLRAYFEILLSGNDFAQSKPHPAIYQAAIQQLGIAPSDALVIEDSQNGIASGKDAGATVWAISDERFDMNQERADQRMSSLTEMIVQLKTM
ncbi:HAD family hydrolase [Lactococcus fujiensis]|nr:HAD family phosphatase [Lactococcus fujiensis]